MLPLRLSRRWFLPQAVVALQRTAWGLESVAMVPGAFMPLRRLPGTGRGPGASAHGSANRRRPGTLGVAALGSLRGAAWRLLQPVLLVVLYGLTAPLAWLPGLGKLHVVVTYAEAEQHKPSAGLRLRRDEAELPWV